MSGGTGMEDHPTGSDPTGRQPYIQEDNLKERRPHTRPNSINIYYGTWNSQQLTANQAGPELGTAQPQLFYYLKSAPVAPIANLDRQAGSRVPKVQHIPDSPSLFANTFQVKF